MHTLRQKDHSVKVSLKDCENIFSLSNKFNGCNTNRIKVLHIKYIFSKIFIKFITYAMGVFKIVFNLPCYERNINLFIKTN